MSMSEKSYKKKKKARFKPVMCGNEKYQHELTFSIHKYMHTQPLALSNERA